MIFEEANSAKIDFAMDEVPGEKDIENKLDNINDIELETPPRGGKKSAKVDSSVSLNLE